MSVRMRGICITALALLVAGCGSGAASPNQSAAPSSMASGAPPSSQRLLAGQPLETCTFAQYAAFCGTLRVPEDRSNPSGRKIGLKVVVVPATSKTRQPDAFFPLDGGPGGAASIDLTWLPGVFAHVLVDRDIVLVDQRGTGGSNELIMPPTPDTTGMAAAQADARMQAWEQSMLSSVDGDPRFYTSSIAADDLDDVRAALGYEKIDLYGPSYGATIAQYYIRQHGDHVRVAILDGGTPVDVPIFERMAANSEMSLELLLRRCAADAACHTAFPNLAAEWTDLVTRLAKGGVTTNVVDPATGKPGVVGLAQIGNGLHQALRDYTQASKLPLAIHLASQGRWDAVAAAMGSSSGGGKSVVMAAVIRCSEAWARYDPAEVERQARTSYALANFLGDARGWVTLCRYIPKGVTAADDAAPIRTSLPVLWVAGDGDPQDPPAGLIAIPSQQPNSRIVVMPIHNHTVGHLGCMPVVISDFVDAGTAAGLDTSCVSATSPGSSFVLS